LQMAHGLQTHTVPDALDSRSLVARRMGFKGDTAEKEFNDALNSTTAVRTYDRLFASRRSK
jgi:glutamine synthetase adenylyltransferase